ncbi:hypothetical protein ACIBF1_05260 [Spirillospora sp. NPDC050679]
MSFAEPACPVCGASAAGLAACADCGWVLHTAWRSGPGDPGGFGLRLAQARAAHDLRAAARAGEHARAYVRGSFDDAEWTRLRAEAEREGAGASAVPALVEILNDPGGTAAVVEIGPDGLRVLLLNAADLDAPDPLRLHAQVPWHEVAPMLAHDPVEQRFQLAGGLYRVDRTVLLATMGLRLGKVLETVPPGAPTAVVCTAPGWPVPERAAAILGRLRPGARVAASGVPLAEAVREARRGLPLHVDYRLIVAEDGPDGLLPALVSLFPPGSAAGQEAEVRVARGFGGDEPLVLAVVPDGGPDAFRTPVSLVSARLPRGTSTVRAVLDGPGQVRWLDPADPVPERRTLEELFEQAAEGAAAATRAELLCAVELGGPPVQAGMRRELVAALLDRVAADMGSRVAVSVYGYYEHSFTLGEEGRSVTEGVWRADPKAARAAFAALPGPPADATWQADAAPLEDALAEIADRLEADPRLMPRTLLVVAGRPPHPLRQGQDPDRELAQPCPRRDDWTRAHDFLRRAGCRFVAVLDKETAPDEDRPGAEHWRLLAADHREVLEDTSADRVADALLPAPPGRPAFPFPMKGDPA